MSAELTTTERVRLDQIVHVRTFTSDADRLDALAHAVERMIADRLDGAPVRQETLLEAVVKLNKEWAAKDFGHNWTAKEMRSELGYTILRAVLSDEPEARP